LSSHAADNAFGKEEKTEGALIGIIYDLKQDQHRRPTGIDPAQYPKVVSEFVKKNWDESVLNRFFRPARALYATQLFIPQMSADEAPKAFGVENVVKPAAWVIHYKGQVSPPEDGKYRFLCFADDLMVVAVNGT